MSIVKTKPQSRVVAPSRTVVSFVGLAIVLLLVTVVITSTQQADVVFVFNTFLLAAMGASALGLLSGVGGQLSIGNAAFLAVGAFTTAIAAQQGLGFVGCVVLSALVAAALGAVVSLPAARLRGVYLALTTLAAHFIVIYVAMTYQRRTAGEIGFEVPGLFPSAGLSQQQSLYAFFFLAVLLGVLLTIGLLRQGKSGRAWRLIRDHELVAPALGISPMRHKIGMFMTTSAIVGVQGSLAAHLSGHVGYTEFTLMLAFSYVAMIYIGGADSLWGPVLGAAIVVGLPEVIARMTVAFNGDASPGTAAQYSQIVYGALVIIFVTRSRAGIVGWFIDLADSARDRRQASHDNSSVVTP